MPKWFRDIRCALYKGADVWRKLRSDYDDCAEICEASSSSLPSPYSLVSNVKYAMEHAAINRLLVDGCTTLHTKQFPYVEVAMFVANAFCSQTGNNIKEVGCLYEQKFSEPDKRGDRERLHCSGRLVFSESMYGEFVAWLDNYTRKFPDDYAFKTLLPIVKDGDLVAGYFVAHNCEFEPRRSVPGHDGERLSIPDDELYDEWQWMLANASGRVQILHSMWVFEDSSDAMLYQLQMR